MPTQALRKYLEERGVRYQVIPHATTYTAQRTAQATHVPGREVAKTVIVRVDGALAMAVLPASDTVDLNDLREELGARCVELAREHDFHDVFPGCEVGAMPPFGNLYGLPVYVDDRLEEDEEITFAAGTHTEALRLRYRDYERLVQPTVLAFHTLRS